MTTFWKPVHSNREVVGNPKHFKSLGRGLYTLWGRCDLCFRSGPISAFHLLRRGTEDGELCDDCFVVNDVVRELREDGWSVL